MRPSAHVLVALLCVACGDSPTDPPRETATGDRRQLRADAHRAALERALPLAIEAFRAGDPIAAMESGKGPAIPTPARLARLAKLRELHENAWREVADIDGDVLEPEEAMVLRTIRFGLNRARDRTDRHPPTRSDPGWYVAEIERFVDVVAWQAAHGRCDGCREAFVTLVTEAAEAMRDLGAGSAPTLTSATDDLRKLADRIDELARRHVALQEPAQQAARALRIEADALGRRIHSLPPSDTRAWQDVIGPSKDDLGRLPGRLGARALQRRLDVEEGIVKPAKDLFVQLGQTLARLDAMRAKLGEVALADRSRSFTKERCLAVRARVQAWKQSEPTVVTDEVDCDALAVLQDGRALDDASLTVFVIRHGVVVPTQRRRRSEEAPVLALVAGRITPTTHRHVLTISVLANLGERAAAALAIGDARDAACLAATALWVHGELGTDEELTDRLTKNCPDRPATTWIAEAIARPRAALEGLGLTLLEGGPAEAVALGHYHWAPLGLVSDLAHPRMPAFPPAPAMPLRPNVNVTVESLTAGKEPR